MRNRLTRGISGICEKVSFASTSVDNPFVKSHARANGSAHNRTNPAARTYIPLVAAGAAGTSMFLFAESMGTISAPLHGRERPQLRKRGDSPAERRGQFALSLFRSLQFPSR